MDFIVFNIVFIKMIMSYSFFIGSQLLLLLGSFDITSIFIDYDSTNKKLKTTFIYFLYFLFWIYVTAILFYICF
jgi:hypothetical protein